MTMTPNHDNDLCQRVSELKPSEAKIMLWFLCAETRRHRPIDQPAVQNGTRLTPPTIKAALARLTHVGMLLWRNGGYYVNKKIFSAQKNFFTIIDDDESSISENSHHQQQYEKNFKIFSQIKDGKARKIGEPVLSHLSETISENVAQAWANWIPKADAEFTNPIGFMVSCLQVNPEQLPPMPQVKSTWYDEYKDLVQR